MESECGRREYTRKELESTVASAVAITLSGKIDQKIIDYWCDHRKELVEGMKALLLVLPTTMAEEKLRETMYEVRRCAD